MSPLLFVLYTNSSQNLDQDRHIIKFADDSVIISLLHDADRDPVVDESQAWCGQSLLNI